MTLTRATEGKEYIIKKVDTLDRELDIFLFTLGAYEGEPIRVVSRLRHGLVIYINGSKYSIDKTLSQRIEID